MQKKQSEAVAALTVVAVTAGVALFAAVKTELRERKIRKEIDERTTAEIARIRLATEMIKDDIEKGVFDGRFYDVWMTHNYYVHVLRQEES